MQFSIAAARVRPRGALARVAADSVSRRKFMVLTGGSATLAVFLTACGGRDVGILNFALTLEYLESTFYREAKSLAKASGDLASLVDLVPVPMR